LIKINGRKKYHELSGWQAACYLVFSTHQTQIYPRYSDLSSFAFM
jgi:hypothetical protein